MTDLKRAAHQLAEADEYLAQLDDNLAKARELVRIVRRLFGRVQDAVLEAQEVLG